MSMLVPVSDNPNSPRSRHTAVLDDFRHADVRGEEQKDNYKGTNTDTETGVGDDNNSEI